MSELPNHSLQVALTWLSGEPDGDIDAELADLCRYVEDADGWLLSAAARQELLGLFCQRAFDVCGRFRPALLTCELPVPAELHAKATVLNGILLSVSRQLQALYEEVRYRKLWPRQADLSGLSDLSHRVHSETYLLSILLGAAAPFGLWQRIHAVWRMSGQIERLRHGETGAKPSKSHLRYKRLLAIAVSQTESLTAREQQWLFDYLEPLAREVLLSLVPPRPAASAYWFDPKQDMPPVACVRRLPEKENDVVYLSLAGIVHRTGAQILWLEKRLFDLDASARSSGDTSLLERVEASVPALPLGLTPLEILSLLRRLRERWAAAPERGEARSRQHYTVQVCAGLKSVWAMGRESAAMADEWTVYNESPGGYGILCVGDDVYHALSAGMVLALRRESMREWAICVVRWVRTDSPQQIELGLQVLGEGFTPVSICFRGGSALAPALMMQSSVAARGNCALVAEAGTYISSHFVLVRENENLYIAQGQALGLAMQTARIELFQYEIDHYSK
ncbi:MAG: hypothetical protein LBP86_02855 [Azoarcus sp.]|jgi:hypothetical protein|nr:hypothetical protein [Azoarcus sp.]